MLWCVTLRTWQSWSNSTTSSTTSEIFLVWMAWWNRTVSIDIDSQWVAFKQQNFPGYSEVVEPYDYVVWQTFQQYHHWGQQSYLQEYHTVWGSIVTPPCQPGIDPWYLKSIHFYQLTHIHILTLELQGELVQVIGDVTIELQHTHAFVILHEPGQLFAMLDFWFGCI